MSTSALLSELAAAGVRLTVDGGQLRVRAPEGALTPGLQARLRGEKSRIMAVLADVARERTEPRVVEAELIPTREGDGPQTLSLSQQRLWFMDALTPGTTFLNLPCAFSIRGPLEIEHLRRTLDHLVTRHETLRTMIRSGDSGPVQVVLPAVDYAIDLVDLTERAAPEDPDTWKPVLRQKLAVPIPIDHAPLFRTGLIRLGNDHHVFWFMTSHLVWDGWSFDVFVRDLCEAYRAVATGTPLPPPLSVRFGDYVAWHREWLERAPQRASLEYWKRKLANLPSSVALPFDHARPKRMSYRGTTLPFVIPADLVGRLRALACERGATLYMVMLAALHVLLHGYTGQRDIVVGAPVDGRVRPELEGLIGLFVNTLVLRTELDPSATFEDLVASVKATCLEAYEHQHTPFEQLVEALRPERDRSRTPLFQVMFSYQQIRDRDSNMGPVRLDQFHVHAGNAGTDLTYWVKDDGSKVYGAFEYAVDLFERGTVEWISRAMMDTLAAVVEAPERPIGELRSPPSHDEALSLWNETARRLDLTLVHRRFEAAVDEAPERTALIFEGRAVSYAELDARANRIAWRLRRMGVTRDARVAVCMRRSVDLVVALLGAMKAGGAYVPLDPSYPVPRLEEMLEDSGAHVLVVDESTRSTLCARKASVFDVDDREARIEREPSTRLVGVDERPDQLAYVIYTSGSTGRPKGVLIEHRNVACFLRGMEERIDLSWGGVWLAGTSVSFDISVLELFGSLTHGMTVVLLGERRMGVGPGAEHDIPRSIARHGVTHFQCTPSQATMLLADPDARVALGRIRQLLVGGEALPRSVADELLGVIPNGELLNMYGPTETCIWSTTHRVGPEDGTVAIGRPIANTRCYVLDERGAPVPIGAVGELYIGGDAVARGYHDRPDLTAERFLDDHFAGRGRMYRTGDLVRFRPDGVLEYRGRNDFQVKVRGHRVELGEIEQVLESHPDVHAAVVVARIDASGAARLVGYVRPCGLADGVALRSHVAEQLPPFMVPSVIVPMDALPLTPNGKIDRKALPDPDGLNRELPMAEAPRDALERLVAGVWAEALGRQRVGRDEDFFELGGHSLLGVRILSRLEAEYDVRLSLAVLFDAPTVGSLAATIRTRLSAHAATPPCDWTTIVRIQPRGDLAPLFCVAGRGGNPMNLRHLARALGERRPFLGLQHRGVDGVRTPHERIEDMAREFVEDVRRVQPEGPYVLSGFSSGGVVAWEMAQQLATAGETVSALLLLESTNPELRWTWPARLAYHRQQLQERGPRYVWERLRGRALHELERVRDHLRARAGHRGDYAYRNDAVTAAFTRALARYRVRPFDGPVTLLRSRVRDTVVLEPTNGWGGIASDLHVAPVEGSHVTFVDESQAAIAADVIAEVLRNADGSGALEADRESSHGAERSQVWTLAG